MRLFFLLFVLCGVYSALAYAKNQNNFPMLNIGGFAWAENLAFDGLGGLFISENDRGKLYRINYDKQANNYTVNEHVSRGFKQFGGLSVTPDGQTLYAGGAFDDNTFGVISVPTKAPLVGQQSYTVLTQTLDDVCNGMMLVPGENALYGTSSKKGTLTRIDAATGENKVVVQDLVVPDGLFYDELSNLLFIGELLTKNIRVFDVSTQSLLPDTFPAASKFGLIHMMDDLAVLGKVDANNLGQTKVVAADWTGKQIIEFTLDGSWSNVVTLPNGIELFEPTSIRVGKGFGFDENSYYITEGGGMTGKTTNRRVLQLTPGSV